ncbi:GNAT family N-acetyltransferase [Kribbella amoyensis]|uniref:GNAT family N-acetyltransferase n=1 Tax=Kribbella amoyensis TaxID=996641 RepID=UPI001EE2CCBF|nr:GNAT family N-acetyltransferase [Kribbella amoyensis]
MTLTLESDRLLIRDWEEADAEAAVEIYGSADVAQWLSPAIERIDEVATMKRVLAAWVEAQPNFVLPAGRWAVLRKDTNELVGGLLIRLLPPYEEDLEIGWQLKPSAWGYGYATEASRTLMRWAFTEGGIDELFAVARPHNERALATAGRLGMEWVGETDKYYGLNLQVYRIRAGDFKAEDAKEHPPAPGDD